MFTSSVIPNDINIWRTSLQKCKQTSKGITLDSLKWFNDKHINLHMSVQPAAFKLIIYQNKGGNICHVGCNDGSKCVRYSWPHVCTLSVCLCFILHAHNLKHDLFPQSFVTVVQLDGHETHDYFYKILFLFYGHFLSIHLDKSFSCSTN